MDFKSIVYLAHLGPPVFQGTQYDVSRFSFYFYLQTFILNNDSSDWERVTGLSFSELHSQGLEKKNTPLGPHCMKKTAIIYNALGEKHTQLKPFNRDVRYNQFNRSADH